MLIQSSFLSIEPTLFHDSDLGKHLVLYNWLGTGRRQMCHNCNDDSYSCCRKAILVTERRENADLSCPLTFISSQHSTISTMSEKTVPNLVYSRRKQKENPIAKFSAHEPVNTKRSDDCFSVVSSNVLSATKEQHFSHVDDGSEAIATPFRPPATSHSEPSHLRSDSAQEERTTDGAAEGSKHKGIEVDSINDSCSSSKSNVELVSASRKTGVDDTGECSSSSVIALEDMDADLSERDLCISILKREGLLEGSQRTQSSSASAEGIDRTNDVCFKQCKICSHSENVLEMLICDHCEEAFHLSCCNPRVKDIPTDQWFCHSCSTKKCKGRKGTVLIKSSKNIDEAGNCRSSPSKEDSSSLSEDDYSAIELMLRDTEPYESRARVGKGFQPNIPDWRGPVNDIVDATYELLELDLSKSEDPLELESQNLLKLQPTCNWLQCRQPKEGSSDDENICGKWRRAPLHEVQTDEWECFCCVHWDPAHADCAVPQELETDQVMKQLKYKELLKPRLAARKRKLDSHSNNKNADN